ncbi:hypothetical protein QQ045_000955 [Rhodiola kirilowii]
MPKAPQKTTDLWGDPRPPSVFEKFCLGPVSSHPVVTDLVVEISIRSVLPFQPVWGTQLYGVNTVANLCRQEVTATCSDFRLSGHLFDGKLASLFWDYNLSPFTEMS